MKWYLVLIGLIFLEAFINAIMDNIDHHKGTAALRDFWHLVKLFDRGALIAIGVSSYFVKWDLAHALVILPVLYFAKNFWLYFYKNHVQFWRNIDDGWKFTTRIKFFDCFLGFDK